MTVYCTNALSLSIKKGDLLMGTGDARVIVAYQSARDARRAPRSWLNGEDARDLHVVTISTGGVVGIVVSSYVDKYNTFIVEVLSLKLCKIVYFSFFSSEEFYRYFVSPRELEL